MRLINVTTMEVEEFFDDRFQPYAALSYQWGGEQIAPQMTVSSYFKYKIRLLNVRTLEVEEFFGHRIPPYTILSHTWGTDEVTFSDIQSSHFKDKKGFGKIEYACKQTIGDGWNYTWIDTCCIDKTSSAELSEAINSMFQWYLEAEVCYAYLADVHEGLGSGLCEQDDAASDSIEVAGGLASPCVYVDNRNRGYDPSGIRETSFGRSRWFTRGWTLQELVAPREVKFYSADWKFLGSKRELARALQQITSIDCFILTIQNGRLLQRALDETCAARKMSWASKRETTRPEDIAYCLLGLFGINMPLLYGEGVKAFTRLQQEIARVSNDQSLLAWEFACTDESDRDATLFARDPSYFTSAGSMVRHDINGNSFRPWTLTNLGISLEVPVLQTQQTPGRSTCTAILSCHYEDDMRGPIGIRLEPFGTGSVRYDIFAPTSSSPRLIILDEDRVRQNVARPIHIVDNKIFFTPIRLENVGTANLMELVCAQTKKFWVRLDRPTGGVFEQYEAIEWFPPACWNSGGMTVCFQNSVSKQAALRLQRFGETRSVVVNFGSQIMNSASSLPWVHLELDEAGRSLEQISNDSARRLLLGNVSEYLMPRVTIRACINHMLRMGEPCFVVAVDFQVRTPNDNFYIEGRSSNGTNKPDGYQSDGLDAKENK